MVKDQNMPTNLYTCLDELGTSEREVVAKLRQLGIKGDKKSARWCPIAQYLVSLGFSGVTVGATVTTDTQRCWLPNHLLDFTKHFDADYYPGLVAE